MYVFWVLKKVEGPGEVPGSRTMGTKGCDLLLNKEACTKDDNQKNKQYKNNSDNAEKTETTGESAEKAHFFPSLLMRFKISY